MTYVSVQNYSSSYSNINGNESSSAQALTYNPTHGYKGMRVLNNKKKTLSTQEVKQKLGLPFPTKTKRKKSSKAKTKRKQKRKRKRKQKQKQK